MSDVRPIDANDLKRDFAELCATECTICSFYISSADVGDCHCGLIDRAPTVAIYTKDDMTNEYLKGYNACKDIIKPTGHWMSKSDDIYGFPTYLCSNCQCEGSLMWKYCPHCGAKMKGEADND